MKTVFYLKQAWIRNNKFLTINILGLTIGLTVSILLFLYVLNELNFDKHFENSDRIATINTKMDTGEGMEEIALTGRYAYINIAKNVPNIKALIQMMEAEPEFEYNKTRFTNVKTWLVDPDFFRVFSAKFIYGDENALKSPNTVVLTKSQAKKIFGNENPIGKDLLFGKGNFTITAVVEDLPVNTHFQYDAIFRQPDNAYNGSINYYTYFLVDEKADFATTCKKVNDEYTRLFIEDDIKNFPEAYLGSEVVPLTDIHFNTGVEYSISGTNTMKYLVLLSLLALIILILAITNFTNLFLIQSNKRSTEIGLRKVNGATRNNIAAQFFNETSMVVFFSFFLGILLSKILLPYFENLLNVRIEHNLYFNWAFILGIIVLILLVTIFSGAYPSLYLSKLNPTKMIAKKGSSATNQMFTSVVSIVQSSITIILMACIMVIMLQTKYLKDMPLGYNPSNIMVIKGYFNQHYESIKTKLMNLPDVESVTAGCHVFGENGSGSGISRVDNPEQNRMIDTYELCPGSSEQLRMELVAGEYPQESDSVFDMLLNESAAKLLGIEDNLPVDIICYQRRRVVGILKDFCYDQPGSEIMPMGIISKVYQKRQISIKFNNNIDRKKASNLVEPIFKEFDPEFVMNPTWMADIYNRKFTKIKELSRVLTFSTMLALLIAIMGIVATHSASVNTRIKEIGIRKTLGSTTSQIIVKLCKRVFIQTFIAIAIAIPFIIPIGNKLLEQYAYHIKLSPIIFIVPAIIQLFIVLLTTLYISYTSASKNPVTSLRYE